VVTLGKNLGSVEMTPSTITFWAYNGFLSQSDEIFKNIRADLEKKMVLINIEVIDPPLDYNILL
jgi:hypothetical protein